MVRANLARIGSTGASGAAAGPAVCETAARRCRIPDGVGNPPLIDRVAGTDCFRGEGVTLGAPLWIILETLPVGASYNPCRETTRFDAVESASLRLQPLSARREIRGALYPIRAVPLRPVGKSPGSRALAGKTIEFPVNLDAGSWFESNGSDDCGVDSLKGARIARGAPLADWPTLALGSFNHGHGS